MKVTESHKLYHSLCRNSILVNGVLSHGYAAELGEYLRSSRGACTKTEKYGNSTSHCPFAARDLTNGLSKKGLLVLSLLDLGLLTLPLKDIFKTSVCGFLELTLLF